MWALFYIYCANASLFIVEILVFGRWRMSGVLGKVEMATQLQVEEFVPKRRQLMTSAISNR